MPESGINREAKGVRRVFSRYVVIYVIFSYYDQAQINILPWMYQDRSHHTYRYPVIM